MFSNVLVKCSKIRECYIMEENYALKKEAIKKAAIKTFASYGYAKTTLDDIARSVGIKKNSLYYYFESKEVLFTEIIKDVGVTILSTLKDAISQSNSCEEKVLEFCRISDSSHCETAKLYSIKASSFLEFGLLLQKSEKNFVAEIRGILVSVLKEGIKKGEFIKHDPEELANVILDITFAMEFIQLSKLEIEFFKDIKQKTQNEITDYMLKAVKYILQGIKK